MRISRAVDNLDSAISDLEVFVEELSRDCCNFEELRTIKKLQYRLRKIWEDYLFKSEGVVPPYEH